MTIIAAIPVDKIAATRTSIEALGNPASSTLRSALDAIGLIHFASINVFAASAGDRGHLVFEFSGDGDPDDLLQRLAGVLSTHIDPVFAQASDRGSASLYEFWKSRVVTVGQSPFANPGVNFSGTPDFSVERIKREGALAAHLAASLSQPLPAEPALQRLNRIRDELRRTSDWRWALEPAPIAQGGAPDLPKTLGEAVRVLGILAAPFAKTFLWPLLIPIVAAFALSWWTSGFTLRAVWPALGCAALVAAVMVALAIAATFLLYRKLRRHEEAEIPQDRPPNRRAVDDIMKLENFAAQNHLAALSVMKTGCLRRFTITLVFWGVAQLVQRYFRPGFLASLGTIHFARWVTVPKTGDLLFLSNYGGSWESYLEDFITKAHTGLTGIWSNTVDFPKTANLFQDGASDGERFKRWARRQQVPTSFWYSAYPDLTTANIRTNAAIRQGLGAALTESEARQWLSLFGSAARPDSELESHEIQSLIFGGLKFLEEGTALLFELSQDNAKLWLRDILPSISFSDGRTLDEAIMLALAASALPKLGLPQSSIATFPPSFTDGMSAPWRSRALGDVGANAPDKWWWGQESPERIDGVLLLYAKTKSDLAHLQARISGLLQKHGHALRRAIPFRSLAAKDDTSEGQQAVKCEPFGFVDGISQPVIRGTYKALRGADAIHLVEPGEFILGYPDNRGHIPPSPTLAAINDPTNVLPVATEQQTAFSINTVNLDRDLGRNGSFLAIRQLEQNVDEFRAFCKDEGARLQPYFPPGVQAPPEEYIAAKIVGRWRDGSPVSRYPRYPASAAPGSAHSLLRTSSSGAPHRTQGTTPIAPSPPKIPGAVTTGLAPEPDNDFLFGSEDPQGLRCPFGAHIRRANPRESFVPGSQEQLGITNRHRIMRVGRVYEPQQGQKDGLFFMCLNGDLERQFEFVQQTWVQSPSFHGLAQESDPLISGHGGRNGYTIPMRSAPLRLGNLPSFVSTRGGGYFFLPGKRTLQFLGS